MQSGAFLSHEDAAGDLKVFSNRTSILFYKVIKIYFLQAKLFEERLITFCKLVEEMERTLVLV